MADIRVTCPTCKTQLEIDEVHEGEEVECGNCLQVFVATKKPRDAGTSRGSESGGGKVRGSTSRTKASRGDDDDDDDRPRRKRRRDDDDDDYDHDDEYYDRPRRAQSNGMATTALVLGILSVLSLLGSCIPVLPVACCAGLFSFGFSVGAIITGIVGMKRQQAKGMAVTGLVLGVLTLVIFLVLFTIGFVIGFNGAMNGNPPNNNKFR